MRHFSIQKLFFQHNFKFTQPSQSPQSRNIYINHAELTQQIVVVTGF
jgi:hypothetical protein